MLKASNKNNEIKNYSKQLAALSFLGVATLFWQLSDAISYYKNPEEPLSCNLNPIVDCGGVLNHNLSSLFGMPNTLIGIVVFSLLLGIGLSILLSENVNRKLLLLTIVLSSVMFLFSAWFFGVSLYIIGKVCIFCVGVWAAVIPIFVLTIRQYLMLLKPKQPNKLASIIDRYPLEIIISIYVLMIAMYLLRFQEYYFS